jgi:hypothetical protein
MPTRPLGRQSWEWGSSWLAKISGHALPVTVVAAHAATPITTTGHNLHHVASVRLKIHRTDWSCVVAGRRFLSQEL